VSWPELIGWIIAVPLLALAIGFSASWVINGYSRDGQQLGLGT
jgi:hypothetical protein